MDFKSMNISALVTLQREIRQELFSRTEGLTLAELEEYVCAAMFFRQGLLSSRVRRQTVVDTRKVFAVIALEIVKIKGKPCNQSDIARHFKVHHTTVLHWLQDSADLLETDSEYQEMFFYIADEIHNKCKIEVSKKAA